MHACTYRGCLTCTSGLSMTLCVHRLPALASTCCTSWWHRTKKKAENSIENRTKNTTSKQVE